MMKWDFFAVISVIVSILCFSTGLFSFELWNLIPCTECLGEPKYFCKKGKVE